MLKLIKKYFVTILSIMLILSNFSYTTHLMLCGMSKDAMICECNHENAEQNNDLTYTNENNKCCTDEITELKNINILSTVKIDLPKDINFFGALILNLSNNVTFQNNVFVLSGIDKEHVPKSDIPILISSLLI